MTSTRTPRTTSIAALCAALTLLAACSSEEEQHPDEQATTVEQVNPEKNTPTRPVPDSTGIMPTVRNAPDPIDGTSTEAAAVAAQRFLEQWVQFSPSRPDAKEYWFSSWDNAASSDFRAAMRRQADSMWSWTWNQSLKTCCVEFPHPAEASVGSDEAVAKVPLTRWVMPLVGTQEEIEKAMRTEEKTYLVWMSANGESFKVESVDEVPADAPLPHKG